MSDSINSGKIKVLDTIGILLSIGIVIYYYSVCFRSAINFPMGDDMYQTTIWFDSFYNLPSYTEQMKYYFMQYNSHFLLFHYLCSVFDYLIFGHVSYRHLILIGNLMLLPIWYLLFIQFREKEKPNFLLFLPITLVLFTPVDQMVNWAATAAHNGGMLFFGLFALYAFTKQKTMWTLTGSAAMFMSMFSLVGGIAVPVAGLIMFFFISNKDYKQLGIWLFFSLAFYSLFFSLWENIVVAKHAMNYKQAGLLFLSFLGSAASFESKFRVMAPTLGIISLVLILFSLIKSEVFKKRPGLLGALLFMMGIAFFTAVGRNYLGPLIAMKNKYFWMQAVFIAALYITYLKLPLFKELKVQLLGLVVVLLLAVPVYISMITKETKIINRSHANSVEFINNYNRELKKGDHGVYHAANIQIIVNRAIKNGYFRLPDFYEGRPVEMQ